MIEPIHEMLADELQHGLNAAREHPEVLNTIADSIRQSLSYFFPDFSFRIQKITDDKEARYAKSWANNFYPLAEGVTALRKIYLVLHNYEDLDDFLEMEAAIKDYARIASQYFHDQQMQEADREKQEAAPLIEEGKKRRGQLTAPRNKKNKALLQYCTNLMRARLSPSASHLWRRFPEKQKAVVIDGVKIYRETEEDGVPKIFCISPSGKKNTVGTRAFQDYFKEVKESWNDNS